jgi:hypothetical protein
MVRLDQGMLGCGRCSCIVCNFWFARERIFPHIVSMSVEQFLGKGVKFRDEEVRETSSYLQIR